jgi:hypothetical protein
MNKIVTLKKWRKLYDALGQKTHETCSADLLYRFGMKEHTPLILWSLMVIDESKFALFMLEHSEFIEKISYE